MSWNLRLCRFSFSIHSPRPLLAARKSRNEKGKKKTSKAKTKASFHHSAKQKGLKAKKTTGAPVEPQPEHVFCGYDLSPLPLEARPDFSKGNKGQHSFTLKDSADRGGACVEVLLRHEAYFIKKMRPDFPGPYGQISWSKHGGPREAWELVKERAGFDRSD